MGCGVSSGPNAHQPQPAQARAVPYSTQHATVVQPRAMPHQQQRGGPGQMPSANAHVAQSDTQMSAPIVRSLVNLDRDSLDWSAVGDENCFSFKVDSTCADGCEVNVYFLVHEQADEATGSDAPPPSFGGARIQRQERVKSGLKQVCKIPVEKSLDLAEEIKNFGAEKEGFYHLVLDVAAATPEPNAVSRQLSYIKLSEADGRLVASLSKQKVIIGETCRELSTLYGNFVRPKRAGQGDALGNEVANGGGDGADCVICLSNPRDTVIIPCRHVCLCSACARVTSSTWSFQCPVCRARVAAMVGLQAETAESADNGAAEAAS
eukprot:TRINITY_DN84625_c0_g1_i1.p1 TRINITY_DN84625_c0_g1~~TRINITY_DN84625_c0_g1_i1.p1  ORF type:complete len:321 (+),score=64.47 TRINITY_DN84625_c0_g1_i1:139-1101(+)